MALDISLSVNLGGLEMKNPVTCASGTFASGREYSDFVDVSKMGAVTTKGVSFEPWDGNDSPRIAETPSGMLNSIGLQNKGAAYMRDYDIPWLKSEGAVVIANVLGHSLEEYPQVLEVLEESDVDAYEINVSCPNVSAGGMSVGSDPGMLAEVVASCRKMTSKPLIIKLTPNVTDIAELARICEANGADAISAINTLLGMAIDARKRKPVLARGVGGLSGPCVKPVALRCVWECYKAVNIPILGMGGIRTGEDAIEFMLAGATAVAVGTANFIDPRSVEKVILGIEEFCASEGVTDIKELIGGLSW